MLPEIIEFVLSFDCLAKNTTFLIFYGDSKPLQLFVEKRQFFKQNKQ